MPPPVEISSGCLPLRCLLVMAIAATGACHRRAEPVSTEVSGGGPPVMAMPVAKVRPDSIAPAGKTYTLEIVSGQRDYYLLSPVEPGTYEVSTSSALARPKTKLVFDAPLAPGAYTLDLRDDAASNDSTVVLNVPLAPGKFQFTVSAPNHARYDLVFHDEGPHKEYRFTLNAPLSARVFELDMPAKT